MRTKQSGNSDRIWARMGSTGYELLPTFQHRDQLYDADCVLCWDGVRWGGGDSRLMAMDKIANSFMKQANFFLYKPTPVSVAVASRASKGCGKLMNTPAPLVMSSQVSSAPQYDKDGHLKYWAFIKAARKRLARKHLMSDEKFARVATAQQVRHVPTTTVPDALPGLK